MLHNLIFIFSSFFKIFFLVVFFGLFQGLAVLPVLLSLFGPDSSQDSVTQNGTMSHLGTQSTFINNDDSVIQNGTLNPSATESNIPTSDNQGSVTKIEIGSVVLKFENHEDSATENGTSKQKVVLSNHQNNSVQIEV